jgi:hypothetical protein
MGNGHEKPESFLTILFKTTGLFMSVALVKIPSMPSDWTISESRSRIYTAFIKKANADRMVCTYKSLPQICSKAIEILNKSSKSGKLNFNALKGLIALTKDRDFFVKPKQLFMLAISEEAKKIADEAKKTRDLAQKSQASSVVTAGPQSAAPAAASAQEKVGSEPVEISAKQRGEAIVIPAKIALFPFIASVYKAFFEEVSKEFQGEKCLSDSHCKLLSDIVAEVLFNVRESGAFVTNVISEFKTKGLSFLTSEQKKRLFAIFKEVVENERRKQILMAAVVENDPLEKVKFIQAQRAQIEHFERVRLAQHVVMLKCKVMCLPTFCTRNIGEPWHIFYMRFVEKLKTLPKLENRYIQICTDLLEIMNSCIFNNEMHYQQMMATASKIFSNTPEIIKFLEEVRKDCELQTKCKLIIPAVSPQTFTVDEQESIYREFGNVLKENYPSQYKEKYFIDALKALQNSLSQALDGRKVDSSKLRRLFVINYDTTSLAYQMLNRVLLNQKF